MISLRKFTLVGSLASVILIFLGGVMTPEEARAETCPIIKPNAGEPLPSNKPTFRWTIVVGAQNYRIQVYDGNGDELCDAMTDGSTVYTCEVNDTSVEHYVDVFYYNPGPYHCGSEEYPGAS